MRKLLTAAVIFSAVIICISWSASSRIKNKADPNGGYAVELNEIENLIEQGESEEAAERAAELRREIRRQEDAPAEHTIPLMCGLCLLFIAGTSAYLWVSVVRPFHKLSDFAERVAAGDLDLPLKYERTNYFGKFTWAFDSMRKEIQRARSCEREAIENNKTVIASLSHDIKTPVATVRAYAEALELGMDGDPSKRNSYIEVIIRKCDEVSRLTDDLLTHSLSDLDKLKMRPERFDIRGYLSEVLTDIGAGRNDVKYERPPYELEVYADKGRTAQIIENLINNARKYAKTGLTVSLTRSEDMAIMHFRDYGGGIPDEDMPFITEKFYRGKNTGNEKGAGLGLYIVRYIAEQSGGDVSLRNCRPGLEVNVSLPITKEDNVLRIS